MNNLALNIWTLSVGNGDRSPVCQRQRKLRYLGSGSLPRQRGNDAPWGTEGNFAEHPAQKTERIAAGDVTTVVLRGREHRRDNGEGGCPPRGPCLLQREDASRPSPGGPRGNARWEGVLWSRLVRGVRPPRPHL